MPSTQQSKIIKAPIDQVWGKLSNFHELPWAAGILPSIEKAGEKNAHEVGAKRILNGAFHETLTRLEPENFRLEYSIDDGPSPVSKEEVSNYIGVIQMSPMVEGDVTWLPGIHHGSPTRRTRLNSAMESILPYSTHWRSLLTNEASELAGRSWSTAPGRL